MVSGLRLDIYDDKLRELGLTTLEERRHRLDMLKTYKILMREGEVRSERSGFRRLATVARLATNPWNIRPQPARLDL